MDENTNGKSFTMFTLEQLYKQWAEYLNAFHDMNVTAKEIEVCVSEDETYMKKLIEGSFTEITASDPLLHEILFRRYKMRVPCYGDSDEYKEAYLTRMKRWEDQNT